MTQSRDAGSQTTLSLASLPLADGLTVVSGDEARFDRGSRSYRVRGLARCVSAQALKVTVRVAVAEAQTASTQLSSSSSASLSASTAAAASASTNTTSSPSLRVHVDTLDLYQARQRSAFIKAAAVELGINESVIAGDVSALVLALEPVQEAVIRAALAPENGGVSNSLPPTLSAQDEAAGLALLRDPDLIDRIVSDVEAIGVVGEGANALVGYVAMVSRLLDKPLAILIQSTSAAGKSTLMDALLSLMPEHQRVQYSAMTGQSLFYLGEGDLQHKILAIAEEEGVRQAAYALKLLQSQGELTIASTGKDPATGKLVTAEYRVQGPVMLCLTTTAIDIDEELLNRCIVLTINESAEQTAAIQSKQRQARTVAGLQTKVRTEAIVTAHRAAQSLLRPLAVVNPLAEQLTFASDRVRLRRDHAKYLALIDAIALLHQYQRPIKTLDVDGIAVDYIEVLASDIALANRLAHAVLGRSLDELPPQTRRVLSALDAWVSNQVTAMHAAGTDMPRGELRFTRRQVRGVLGISDTQLRVHIDRLVELEYLAVHGGRMGQCFSYSLLFDGESDSDAPQLMGLSESLGQSLIKSTAAASTSRARLSTSRGCEPNLAGQNGHLAGRLRGDNGPVAGRLRGGKNAENASADKALGALVIEKTKNARRRKVDGAVAVTP